MEMIEIEMREDIKNNITKKERNEYRVRVIDRAKAAFIKKRKQKKIQQATVEYKRTTLFLKRRIPKNVDGCLRDVIIPYQPQRIYQ